MRPMRKQERTNEQMNEGCVCADDSLAGVILWRTSIIIQGENYLIHNVTSSQLAW